MKKGIANKDNFHYSVSFVQFSNSVGPLDRPPFLLLPLPHRFLWRITFHIWGLLTVRRRCWLCAWYRLSPPASSFPFFITISSANPDGNHQESTKVVVVEQAGKNPAWNSLLIGWKYANKRMLSGSPCSGSVQPPYGIYYPYVSYENEAAELSKWASSGGLVYKNLDRLLHCGLYDEGTNGGI